LGPRVQQVRYFLARKLRKSLEPFILFFIRFFFIVVLTNFIIYFADINLVYLISAVENAICFLVILICGDLSDSDSSEDPSPIFREDYQKLGVTH
jgi:hypothetical protein